MALPRRRRLRPKLLLMVLALLGLASLPELEAMVAQSRSRLGTDSSAASLSASEGTVSFGMRVASKAEIMATMTLDKAYGTLLRVARHHGNHSSGNTSELLELVQTKLHLGRRGHHVHHLRHKGGQPLTGYAALEPARTLLNDMMDEAIMKKELEAVKCDEFERKQLKILGELENDIAFVNSEAANARAELLRAQGVSTVLMEVKLPTTRTELSQHEDRCRQETAALQRQLAIVMSDIDVMKKVLSMVQCDEEGSNDLNAGAALVQCASTCPQHGQRFTFVKHKQVQKMLASLKSQVAQGFIQTHLEGAMDVAEASGQTRKVSFAQLDEEDEESDSPGVDFAGVDERMPMPRSGSCDEGMHGTNASGYHGCQDETISGRDCQKWSVQLPHAHEVTPDKFPEGGLGDHNYCRNPNGKNSIWCYTTDPQVTWEFCAPVENLEVPNGVAKHECIESNSCKLGPGQCTQLRDRFLLIMAGINDKKMELSNTLAQTQHSCEDLKIGYESSIATMEGQLTEEQTSIASSTKMLVENQQQSRQSNEQHKELDAEYHSEMQTCCDNKNSYTAEVCALEKIRGELYKMEGLEIFITDCEVSDWVDEECTRPCGGGTQDRTRSIIVHPNNGTQCPPLLMERRCNIEECPVNCAVSDWSAWSSCSADCDGGVETRERTKLIEPRFGGDPCPDESETRACNIQACNADCELGDWTEWSTCSKACGTGHSERTKPVVVPVKGLGECPRWDDEHRLQFQTCNEFDCRDILPSNRTILECGSKLDIVLLLDGSGSLGPYGWHQTKTMAEMILDAMPGGDEGVLVSVMVFSGPIYYDSYEACTSSNPTFRPDIEKDCGIKFVQHFTPDPKLAKTALSEEPWPAGTTLTSMALAEARSELIRGRTDANSLVLVITDGLPMSDLKTGQAAEELKRDARLLWVPTGRAIQASLENMHHWASDPWEDNVISIADFYLATIPTQINDIIAAMCPKVS